MLCFTTQPSAGQGETPKTDSKLETFHFGLDYYRGITNDTGGNTQLTDGHWAGFGGSVPSNVSLHWSHGEEQTLHISFGIGDMWTGSGVIVKQPMEAYYRLTTGANSHVTVGKYFVPFAIQEWEYESKYGVMYETTRGPMSLVASANYNTDVQKPNFYARAGRQCGAATNIGISAGSGVGLFTATDHDMAFGADITHDVAGFHLTSEYVAALRTDEAFQFAFFKAAYTRLGAFGPYAAVYYWHDPCCALGHFSSAVIGASYKLSPNFSVEAAYARANGRHVYWLQSRTTL